VAGRRDVSPMNPDVSKSARASGDAKRAAAVWIGRDLLKPWARNPRKNEGRPVQSVAGSIKRFGWGAPIVARRDGELVAGHTRALAAEDIAHEWERADESTRAVLLEHWHPDALRTAQSGDVPVRFGDWSEQDAHALALADNRLGELAAWDDTELTKLLNEMQPADVRIAGWDESDLARLAADFQPGDESDQGALGEKKLTTCPECGHEF